MKETVLITGGNSFIARHLVPVLNGRYNVKLLTRTADADNEYAWDISRDWIDERAFDDVQYIVHLAGAKLNNGRPLTEERRRLIRDSRIWAAHLIREKLIARNQKLTAFVSASAIGYYGFTDNTIEIDEDGEKGNGFSADLCEDWEKAADMFKTDQVARHVSKIRVSLVLGNGGGIFPAYKDALLDHPRLALERNPQSFSWNHIEDMAAIFAFAVERKLDGVYNSVAPVPATMQDLFKALANEMLDGGYDIRRFAGKHLVSHKIEAAGYKFKHRTIEEAVSDLIRNR